MINCSINKVLLFPVFAVGIIVMPIWYPCYAAYKHFSAKPVLVDVPDDIEMQRVNDLHKYVKDTFEHIVKKTEGDAVENDFTFV